MVKQLSIRVAVIGGLLLSASALSLSQTYTPPPPPLTTLPPCPLGKNGKPLKKQKNCDSTIYPTEGQGKKNAADVPATSAPANVPAAQQFPFPGEQQPKPADKSANQAFPYPGEDKTGHSSGDADVQHDAAAEKKAAETTAGKAYPFPGGATPNMPADPDMPRPEKQAGETPESSSSSSSSDGATGTGSDAPSASDAPGAKGEYDDDDSASPKLKDKGHKKAITPQTDTERVDEDLSVAKYYMQSGNKMGAYLRAKDAIKVQPEYAEGHFALGEAALGLEKKDEAAAEFKIYLKMAPDGERAKSAEKALEQLQ